MNVRRIIGVALVALGIVALVWGGVFWTDRDTVLDAGPLQVETAEQEGVRLPPLIGFAALVGGLVLLMVPSRSHA
jgi:hypothetical protein